MKKAVKKTKRIIKAYQLGSNTQAEWELIEQGKIRITKDGRYEVFSREAVHGQGELAQPGDYFQIDSGGYPYPNSREFFEKRHKKIAEHKYICIPFAVGVWRKGDPMCEEIEFLLEQKRMQIHPEKPKAYFTAFIWGCLLSAAVDAVVACYEIKRSEDGKNAPNRLPYGQV